MSVTPSARCVTQLLGVIGLLVCAPPAQALDPNLALSQYTMRIWRTAQGLPHDAVISLSQTHDGFLWCGTEHGLARFDGVNFTLYHRSNTPAFTSDSIHALFTDRAGRLWIGTASGGVIIREGKSFLSLSQKDGLIDDTVFCITEDPTGAIWIGTSNGLSRYQGGQFTNYRMENGLPALICRSLCTDANGRVYVGTGNGPAYFDGERFVKIISQEGMNREAGVVRAMQTSKDGSLWFTVGSHLLRWHNNRMTIYDRTDGLNNGYLVALHVDRDGTLWVAGLSGVSRWQNGRFVDQFQGRLPVSGSSFRFHEDTAGNLWIGTSDGLGRTD